MHAEAAFTELDLNDERAKRLIAMGQMAATLAHEIRNPLGSMELFCTLLKKDLATEPASLNLAEQIHLGIRTLDRIITNCLQFARDLKPRYRRLEEPLRFLEEICTSCRPSAEKAGVLLSCSSMGNSPVEVDPDLLSQALLNLVLNAVDAAKMRSAATAASAFTPTVEVSSDTRLHGEWHIAVKDNGVGIAEEDISRMFDPFFTTKSSGTGLGLAITHSIISAHRGTIHVESELNVGTTITLVLPQTGSDSQ